LNSYVDDVTLTWFA